MNASHIVLYRYTIPFTEPITIKGQRLLQREGIIIAIKSPEERHVAYGEIAPLPGLHRETLQLAEAQLVEVLAKHELSAPGILLEGLYPSVRTGLEMAMLNLSAAISGTLPAFSDSGHVAGQVPVNALLFGDHVLIMQRAEKYFQLGYRAFKLKVKADETDQAIKSIRALNRTYGNRIELRLDANQSLTLDEAVEFARNIPTGCIAYIEEPLKEAELIGEFYAKTELHSALDETLWQKPELLEQIPEDAIAALILKPNRLGGIFAALQFTRYAKRHKLRSVFSSAFESGISLSFYTWLAASTASKPAACGLDTYRYLKHDLLHTPFGAENALLDTRKLYQEGVNVNEKRLKRTSLWTL
ncbi:MAG: o-succinylbenzoate synthase [Chlorobiaceae bacterium]|nr:o-succinylbenzoate synthase [Chlorobiaceae bacterium]